MNLKGYIVPLVLVIAIGCFIWGQARGNVRLREEHVRLAAQAVEVVRVKALKVRAQATAVSTEELQNLNAAVAEAGALRDSIKKLKNTQLQPVPSASEVKKRSEERWRNLGQATPHDTLHSIIWAATGGEVDALVTMLAYDTDSRAAADDLFAAIPPESRALFPSADRLVATIIAGRLPTDISEAQLIGPTEENADFKQAKVWLQRARSNDVPREVTLNFQRCGSDWRLIVPQSVVAGFKQSLKSH